MTCPAAQLPSCPAAQLEVDKQRFKPPVETPCTAPGDLWSSRVVVSPFLEARLPRENLFPGCWEVTHHWIEGLLVFVAKAHVKHVCNSLLRVGALRNRMHLIWNVLN